MSLGYQIPGTYIEEIASPPTANPTSSQRKPCFIGKASPTKRVLNEAVIRSNSSNIDSLAYSSAGVASVISVGSQAGLSDFTENVQYSLTSTGEISWKINSESQIVASGSVGSDLFAALGTTLANSVLGANASSGYQGWGFSLSVNSSSNTGLTDDRTAGYQEWGFVSAALTSTATNLVALSTYTAAIAVNGTSNNISILGSTATTLGAVISEINLQLTGAIASWDSTDNGSIKVTSNLTGTGSSILITDTTLFAALASGAAVHAKASATAAVAGTNGVAHAASVSVNGVAKSVTIYGYNSLTIGTLITAINANASITGLALATLDVTSNSIVITSASTGSSSTIAITDTNLFSTILYSNVAASTAVPGANAFGGYQGFGLNVSSSAYTPLTPNSRYFFVVNGTEYMIKALSVAPTYSQLVTMIQTQISASGTTATFASSDIRITNNSTGLGKDVALTAGSNNSASNGQLTITLLGPASYTRYAGKCNILFSPDNGTTNYVFGLRVGYSAGATRITLTGVQAQLNMIDQSSTGSAKHLTILNYFIAVGATYFVSYNYNRAVTDYLTYKEFSSYTALAADLGDEIPSNDLVMLGKQALQTFGLPKIAVVQVPLDIHSVAEDVSYIDALSVIRQRDVQTVCVLNTDVDVMAAVKAHVIEASLPVHGRYRIAYFGAAVGTPIGEPTDNGSITGLAVTLFNERCILINATRATYSYLDPSTGVQLTTVINGSHIAAIIAAYRDSYTSPVMSLLNQTVPMISLFEEDFDNYYANDMLIQAGTSSVYTVRNSSGMCKVVDDLTTDNSSTERNCINIITAKDYLAKDVVIQMNRAFIGQLIKDRSVYHDAVLGFLSDLFKQYQANGVIASVATLTVTLPADQKTTVDFFYSYYAIYTNKYIEGVFTIAV